MSRKSEQLQIRVTPGEKEALRRLAEASGQDMSSYVLSRALPDERMRFRAIMRELRDEGDHRPVLAELNDLLSELTVARFPEAVSAEPGEVILLSPFLQNYTAAMVELAAHRLGAAPPAWVRSVRPLERPHFATPIRAVRLHLLRAAPVPFKRRNIFVDSSIGARV